ncbi:hypothetical protein MVEG_11760 [Podila verticillata NRRL 6337]|uniref:Uncharacterized protein n=1 Tax=Podila verticillata NRRL 6337 TaxID=1069443 RepID=A0A086TJJ4_9FUNG|nr:hypothetical protein MVEG_11760 [Podila verticillata NRRL 6337]
MGDWFSNGWNWDRRVEEEAKDLERQLDRKHYLSLQANAVDQLDAQLQHYTKEIRRLGDVPPVLSKFSHQTASSNTPDDWILVQVYQDHLHDLVPSTRLLAHRGPSPRLSLAQIEQHCLRHLYLSSLPPRAATPLARTDEPCMV